MACEEERRQMELACREPDSESCRNARLAYQLCMLNTRINDTASAVSRSEAIKNIMEFFDCRRSGKSFEECLGIYKASPFPSPGCPLFIEAIEKLPKEKRIKVLESLREIYLARAKEIEALMKK